jgi:hypothetical protein
MFDMALAFSLRGPGLVLATFALVATGCRCSNGGSDDDTGSSSATVTSSSTCSTGSTGATKSSGSTGRGDTSESEGSATSTTSTSTTSTGGPIECGDGRVVAGELCYHAYDTVLDGTVIGTVALGDLDGDGALDIAAGTDAGLSVLFGRGDGSFEPAAAVGGLADVLGIAVARLDSDAIDDLALSSSGADSVAVVLGAAGRNLAVEQTYPTGALPRGIVVGDLVGNNARDVATADQDAGRVTIYPGLGDGTLAPVPTELDTGGNPVALVAADFDQDTDLDLAVAYLGSDTISVFFGDGSDFGPEHGHAGFAGPRALASADLDGDGDADLAVVNENAGSVAVLASDGAGDFDRGPVVAVGAAPRAVTVGDPNTDGKADLVVANRGDDDIGVVVGDGEGAFSAQIAFSVLPGPLSVAVGDVNGDGAQDVCAGSAGIPGGISVLLSNP